MDRDIKDFTFGLSSDMDAYVHIRIDLLDGTIPQEIAENANGTIECRAECQLWAEDVPICDNTSTAYKPTPCNQLTRWNEWMAFPIRYRDLPLNTQLAVTLSTCLPGERQTRVVGGTTFALFGKRQQLRQGRYRCFVWPLQLADSSVPTRTPSKREGVTDEVDRLEKLLKKYERGEMEAIPWLDMRVMPEIERIKAETIKASGDLFLYVDTPTFDFPIVFHDQNYTSTPEHVPAINVVHDPDIWNENLVEAKHRRLIRSHRSGPMDRDLKPNAKIRDELNAIVSYPPSRQLNNEEIDLIWKFRFYLSRDKRALTKFLKSVIWSDPMEIKQATEIVMPMWVDITVDDALELLGPSFQNKKVRQHAVKQLEKAEDEYLQLYLLQLVQAIKFEEISDKGAYESSLVDFLTKRALRNTNLGNCFYWYLMMECEDSKHAKLFGKVAYHFMTRMVEIQGGVEQRDALRRQAELVERFCNISKTLKTMKESRPKKIEWLKAHIADPHNGLSSFTPLPLPLDARIQIQGIVADKATVFKSQLNPLRLTFQCSEGSEYTAIFKLGDDLRQDQLIMQVITLMDKLLLKENLDLKLTPYKILATGSDHGLVEFVPDSAPLAAILANYNNNLQLFLREKNAMPDALESYGIDPAVMDTYIKSCAGYCVITYILGIGDRHLDNLLLTEKGNLFHVDFGYILGRDPKPFPPPMKLCKEMVDAMGGTNSMHFRRFKSLCFTAFTILRKSANLILNLFALMVDANIQDIRLEPDKAVLTVQEKFRLDLSDEEAIHYFQMLINESVNALFPQLMETVHKWAQYWRK